MKQEPEGTIGPYQLIEKLGRGGMGTVYHAVHQQTGQHVALKTVRDVHPGMLQQIRREIHVLSQLDHPGIVSIIEHGMEGGFPWYAMELVHGVTLREYCWGRLATHSDTANELEPDTLYDLSYESPTINVTESQELLAPSAASPGLAPDPAEDPASQKPHQPAERTVAMPPPSASGQWWTYALHPSSGAEEPSGTEEDTAEMELKPAKLPPAPEDPLADLLDVAGLTEQEKMMRLVAMIRRICVPLAHLHGEGLLHCDLKPGNILIRADGWPVLIDFGLLHQFGGGGRETIDFARSEQGTPTYMSPEQVLGTLMDARSDLYGLGCIFYELLTGVPPFEGETLEVMNAHCHTPPTSPSKIKDIIPPAIDQVIMRMLAKKPKDRIGYADTVRHLLGKLVTPARTVPEDWKEALRQKSRVYLYRPGFVGREELLGELVQQLKQMNEAIDGSEQTHRDPVKLWLLQGESGSGKTRLLLELARHAASYGAQVVTGECLDHHPFPLEGFQTFMRALADRASSFGPRETLRLLGEEGRVLVQYAMALQSVPGIEELPQLPNRPPAQMRLLVFKAIQHALRAVSVDTPLLLMLDDLQWADALTLEALHALASAEQSHGVLMIGAYRSEESNEYLESLCGLPGVEVRKLERLDEEGVGAIVRDMLALPNIPKKLSGYLARHSEGNPFFVAEYLRAAVEEGLLWRHPQGRWSVGSKGLSTDVEPDEESLPLPESLRALVTQRLRDISTEATILITSASVLGREVASSMLQQICGLSEEQLWSGLDELQRKQFLVASFEGKLRFTHDKLREVSYESLDPEHRASLHRKAATVLEQYPAELRNTHLADMARHWQHANDVFKALHYYKLAAQEAKKQHANEEAVGLYTSYVELDPHPTAQTIEILHEMGGILKLMGKTEEAEKSFKKAWMLSRQIGARDMEGIAQSLLGQLYTTTGRLDESKRAHETALGIHREVGNRAGEGASLGYLAGYYLFKGELDQAKEHFEAGLQIHRDVGDRDAVARDLGNLASVYLLQCNLQYARKLYEDALGMLGESVHRYRTQILNNLAHVYFYEGQTAKAQELYRESIHSAREQGDRVSEGMALGNLAHTYRDEGHIDEARSAFQEALKIHRDVDNRMFEAIHWVQQLVMDRLLGQNLLALKATLHRIETMVRKTGETPYATLIQCELGHIQLAQGYSAEDRLEKAQEIAESANIRLDSPTEIGVAITRLRKAQEAFYQGQPLFRGQRLEEIPAGLMQRLQQDGHIHP